MNERLPLTRIAEIEQRAEAATPGPWEEHAAYGENFYAYLGGPYLRGVGTLNFGDGDDAEADKALTVNAREDIRALLSELYAVRAELRVARGRVAALENALAAAGRSLSSFIFDSDDPGADALGAQWLYHQAMPQADDPFAQPRALRSSVFSEAAKTVEEMDGRPTDGEYSREYLNGYSHALEDAAERLEKRADQAAEGSEAVS